MTEGSFFGQPFPFVAPAIAMTPIIDMVVAKVAHTARHNLSIHRDRYQNFIEEYKKSMEVSSEVPAAAGASPDVTVFASI